MSRMNCVFPVALLIAIGAPSLSAQTVSPQTPVAVPKSAAAQIVKAKSRSKGPPLRYPSAAQRAARQSDLVVVTGPNGERRLARVKKRR